MQGKQAIVSILYNHNHFRKLGSDEKIRVKKKISELKSTSCKWLAGVILPQ